MSLAAELSTAPRNFPSSSFAGACTSLVNRVNDFCWETVLDVRTTGGASSRHADARDYGYVAYHTYFAIFDHLDLQPADVVVDVGCGKGRVVCIAATYRVSEVLGIEIDPLLCAQAAANSARMRRRRSPVSCICQSAADFNHDRATVVVMFHPFGAATMRRVLARLLESLQNRPRALRVAYVNPLFGDILEAQSWLRRYGCWSPGAWSRLKFPVHFYRTAGA